MQRFRDDARLFLKYEVGDDSKTFMWHENWHPMGSFILNMVIELSMILRAGLRLGLIQFLRINSGTGSQLD